MCSKKPIRVLHVVPSLSCAAGIARFVYNMANNIDEKRVRFDYLHHAAINGRPIRDNTYDQELIDRGSNVYTVNYASAGFGRFVREVKEFFEQHGGEYDVVHCHMSNAAFCVLKEAKKAGIHHRVLHSHLNSSSDKLSHRVRNAPLLAFGKKYVTDRMACSKEAGDYLFGDKPYVVMNNGIPLDQFAYDKSADTALREEFNIPVDAPVVGCVGRFVKQKNFCFAVRVFAAFGQIMPEARLVILGDGDEMEQVLSTAVYEGVSEKVVTPGIREDVARYYSLFDVFFMPSLYEGLPVSAIEAQASGLPCVFSTGVPAESDIAGIGRFVSLDSPIREWSSALQGAIKDGRLLSLDRKLEKAGYSIEANAEALMGFYEKLMLKESEK